jgi:hypothetical protein
MKTSTKIISGMAVLVLALASIGSVSASTIDSAVFGAGFGRGNDEENDGLLADYMEAVIAESLGLSVEELNALEAEGKTHYLIALELGLSAEEFQSIMENAQDEAVALAAADGIVVQQFGMNGNGRGQYGSGLNDGAQPNFGNRADGQFGGGNGARVMDPEVCDGETCDAEPLGMGMGRGGRR